MTASELKQICEISRFELSSSQADDFLKDFGEIIKIMDKIKDWEDISDYAAASKNLSDLREDKPTKQEIAITRDINTPRVVQNDD